MNDTPFLFSPPSYTSDVQKFLYFYFSFHIYYTHSSIRHIQKFSYIYSGRFSLAFIIFIMDRLIVICRTDDESNSVSSRSESGTRPHEVYLQSWRQDPPHPPDGASSTPARSPFIITLRFTIFFFRYSVLFLGLTPNVLQNLNIIVKLGFYFRLL
ncbi:hypothetical protein HanHA300_Chr12g0434941 [Helianthus annuus]|nr:hypothetical protein HanHA300_Chr12g0434941 [Helianthus annuus]KAJ0504798.1 hypothetical protein HanHA89_Chr12g0463311 [Helianthus annuus]